MPPWKPGALATQHQLAAHLDVSARTVRELLAKHVLPKPTTRAGYDLDACRIAYIRHLRGMASGRTADPEGALSLERERAREAKARADAQEMKNELARRSHLVAEEVEAAWIRLVSAARQRVLGVPTKAAPVAHAAGSVHEVEEIIAAELESALQELSETVA